MTSDASLVTRCQRLVQFLLALSSHPPSPLPTPPPFIVGSACANHLLTTAAVVACLAPPDEQYHLLRLAALTHELPESAQQESWGQEAELIRQWVEQLQAQDALLASGAWPDLAGLTQEARWLALAHLVASPPLPITSRAEFTNHPLSGEERVDLVYGGATKIKEYVFESARLPEIRGASALLDHINRLDLPALWGRLPEPTRDPELERKQAKRYQKSREWFEASEKGWGGALNAPECLLYASGGNLLALAPAGRGPAFAEAIERRYTEETATANSVAVAQSFSLLELQYGVRPDVAWDFTPEGPRASEAVRLVKQSSSPSAMGTPKGEGEARTRKGFGELVTVLANRASQRRAGDGQGTGTPRFVPFWELTSYARKCASCDMRPATQEVNVRPRPEPPEYRYFCEPCYTKHQVGRWAKKGQKEDDSGYEWIRPWGTWLEERAQASGWGTLNVLETASDLEDVAGGAQGFVGLIYADGNNVGSAIARCSSPSDYRSFAKQMLEVNERAVVEALVTHLESVQRKSRKAPSAASRTIWPFEVLTIGGDDVLLFVPAAQALAIASRIAASFQRGMESEGISLSVGVLLMPEHTPVRFASELVEDLLKQAKKGAGKVGTGEPTIDFMALKQVAMVTDKLGAYRKIAFDRQFQGDEANSRRFYLTQRPYTLSRLNTLLKACEALKKAHFPRSQLHQLRHHLEGENLLRSAIDYGYFVMRGQVRDRAFKTFDEQLANLCGDRRWLPWRVPDAQNPSVSPTYDTPLLDIIELYPFTEGGFEERGPP